MSAVRRKIAFLAAVSALALIMAGAMGAGPRQDGGPPQPFFYDLFSGRVTVQGAPAPTGTTLVACVDDCRTVFESPPVNLGEGGAYGELKVGPEDRSLVGHTISFFLVNQFGRIRAAETVDFKGVVEMYSLDLTFADPIPVPTPTPTVTPTASLPVPGDPNLTKVPKLALFVGGAAVAGGIFLLLVVRRRVQ